MATKWTHTNASKIALSQLRNSLLIYEISWLLRNSYEVSKILPLVSWRSNSSNEVSVRSFGFIRRCMSVSTLVRREFARILAFLKPSFLALSNFYPFWSLNFLDSISLENKYKFSILHCTIWTSVHNSLVHLLRVLSGSGTVQYRWPLSSSPVVVYWNNFCYAYVYYELYHVHFAILYKFKSHQRMQVEFISNNVDVIPHDCLSSVAPTS